MAAVGGVRRGCGDDRLAGFGARGGYAEVENRCGGGDDVYRMGVRVRGDGEGEPGGHRGRRGREPLASGALDQLLGFGRPVVTLTP